MHLKQVQNAPSHYKIDEFIVQLMTSERFNELADIIAERAARKIKTVEDINVTTLRHSSSDRLRNKNYNKYKPTHARKDTILRERKTEKRNSGKFGKINTKAFLKHDISQELFLNYKHMTKELKRNNEQKTVSPEKTDVNPERGDNKFSDHSTEQFKDKTVNDEGKQWNNMKMKSRVEENDKQKSISSNNKHAYKRDEDSTSNKTASKLNENDHSSLEVSADRTQGITKKDHHSDEKYEKSTTQTTKSVVDDNSSDSSNFESKKEMTDTKETHEHKSRYSSKEVVEVGINRAFSDNDHRSDTSERYSDEKDDLSNSREKHKIIRQPIEKKQIVRRENGKLYTYLSSPDYNDYHESLALIKSKNNYINTYRYK